MAYGDEFFADTNLFESGKEAGYDRFTKLGGSVKWLKNTLGGRQSFRGLHLRTSPDADIAAKVVSLLSADEIVMHDGTSVRDWTLTTADITAAGAGGLDTGSEGASRWYRIYAIRKSTDNTRALILSRAKNFASDQSFTTTTDVVRLLRIATSTPTDELAQSVTAASSAPLQFVDLQLIRNGSVTGRVWVELRSDNAGFPSSTVLARSDRIDASAINGVAQLERFVFRSPYTMTSGTLYHLVLSGDYARDNTVMIGWRGVVAGGYANGRAMEYNGATWNLATGVLDFNFNAYATANDAALTLPSGYDQYAHIGWVFNNSGSDFAQFRAVDRTVHEVVSSGRNSGTITSATGLLVDWSAMVPPVPVVAHLGIASNATAEGSICGVPKAAAMSGHDTFLMLNVGSVSQIQRHIDVPLDVQALAIYGSGAVDFRVHARGFTW